MTRKTTNKTKSIRRKPTLKTSKSLHATSFKEGLLDNNSTKHLGKKDYKEQLIDTNAIAEDYNKLFDQKLAEEYKQFKSLKEHNIQMKKFIRILLVIIIIIIVALLLMNLRI